MSSRYFFYTWWKVWILLGNNYGTILIWNWNLSWGKCFCDLKFLFLEKRLYGVTLAPVTEKNRNISWNFGYQQYFM